MGAAHARSHTQWNRGTMLNVNGVDIEYQFDGAHDARPAEHTLHGLDGLNLSGLDWMRLSHVCRLMAARDRNPERAFVRVSGWTADRPNMRLIMDVLQDDDGTASVPLPLTSDYLLVDSAECDDRCQYGWLSVLEQLPEHVDYGRLDETGMRVVDWLNGMADPSPEIFEDWEAISLIRQNVYEDEPTGWRTYCVPPPGRSVTNASTCWNRWKQGGHCNERLAARHNHWRRRLRMSHDHSENGRYDHYHYSSLASPLDGRLGLEDHHSPMVVRRAGNIRAIRRIG